VELSVMLHWLHTVQTYCRLQWLVPTIEYTKCQDGDEQGAARLMPRCSMK
jgi:hypothetical protein